VKDNSFTVAIYKFSL